VHADSVHPPRTSFVARAREDAAFVRALANFLPREAIAWVVGVEVPEIDPWLPVAKRAIEEADAFIFTSSITGVRSRGCAMELLYALELPEPKPLVHLALDRCALPMAPLALADVPTVFATDRDARTAAANLAGVLAALQFRE
jgi:TIR domain